MRTDYMVGGEYREQHELIVEDAYLNVIIQLKQMGRSIDEIVYSIFFPRKRFQFLVEWDPTLLLIQTDENNGDLPHHFAVIMFPIQAFSVVFDNCIRYYPKKKGISLLFTKNNDGKTSFRLACNKFGYEQVINVIEDTLIRYSFSSSDDNNTNTPPINIVEALVMAAINESIHLYCVYFLLRRQPDLLVELSTTTTTTTTTPVAAAAAEMETLDSNNNDYYDSKQKQQKRKRRGVS